MLAIRDCATEYEQNSFYKAIYARKAYLVMSN